MGNCHYLLREFSFCRCATTVVFICFSPSRRQRPSIPIAIISLVEFNATLPELRQSFVKHFVFVAFKIICKKIITEEIFSGAGFILYLRINGHFSFLHKQRGVPRIRPPNWPEIFRASPCLTALREA